LIVFRWFEISSVMRESGCPYLRAPLDLTVEAFGEGLR